MELRYDKEADAVYITLSDRAYAYGEDLDDVRVVDYDTTGTPIGIELLNVSLGITTKGLPYEVAVKKLLLSHGFSAS